MGYQYGVYKGDEFIMVGSLEEVAAQRTPKRDHPEHMCYQCKEWTACYLDWGECFWMAEAVPGDEYRLLYAYEGCIFLKSKFKPRRAGA